MQKFIADVDGVVQDDKLYINGHRFCVTQATLDMIRENNTNYQKYIHCILKETEIPPQEVIEVVDRKSRKTLEEILQSN
jgi:hypothetical protein